MLDPPLSVEAWAAEPLWMVGPSPEPLFLLFFWDLLLNENGDQILFFVKNTKQFVPSKRPYMTSDDFCPITSDVWGHFGLIYIP